MREFILSHHNGSIDQSFLDDNNDRSAEIPRGEWSAQDITEAGWDLGELRQVLRRLTRKLVRMAIHDNFDRAQEFENRDERNLPLQMTLKDLPDLCFSDDEDDEDDEASHHSDPIGENSDDEEFLADIDNFIGLRKPIFDRCFAFIQKGMPVTLLDVYEIVQEEKKLKSDLRSTQEELDQAQQALKLAEQQMAFKEREFAQLVAKRAEQSIEQREHDLLFLEKNMELEGIRLKSRQIDLQLALAPSGGGKAASGFGSASSIQMISMTSEEAYVVHTAFDWVKWVKLMSDIKEWPTRWDDQRIQRQFTEKVKKEVIASLQHIRSSSTQKHLPSKLKGFDAEIDGKYQFFTLPAAPATFADTIEAYLKANDRDKDGKKIPVTVGQTVVTDSFARYLEQGHNKKKFGFDIPNDKSVQALLDFNMAADRFNLPAEQAVWGEPTQKWVRIPADPALSAEVLAQDKENIKLWFKTLEAAHVKDVLLAKSYRHQGERTDSHGGMGDAARCREACV